MFVKIIELSLILDLRTSQSLRRCHVAPLPTVQDAREAPHQPPYLIPHRPTHPLPATGCFLKLLIFFWLI